MTIVPGGVWEYQVRSIGKVIHGFTCYEEVCCAIKTFPWGWIIECCNSCVAGTSLRKQTLWEQRAQHAPPMKWRPFGLFSRPTTGRNKPIKEKTNAEEYFRQHNAELEDQRQQHRHRKNYQEKIIKKRQEKRQEIQQDENY